MTDINGKLVVSDKGSRLSEGPCVAEEGLQVIFLIYFQLKLIHSLLCPVHPLLTSHLYCLLLSQISPSQNLGIVINPALL